MAEQNGAPGETPAPKQYRVTLSRTVSLMDGFIVLRPSDENIIVSDEIRAEIEALGALIDAVAV